MAALTMLATYSHASSAIVVNVIGDRIDISVNESSSLDAVLTQIANAVGAQVEGGGCKERIGPITLKNVTFNEALRTLAPAHSFIVEYQPKKTDIKRLVLIEPSFDSLGLTAGVAQNAQSPLDEQGQAVNSQALAVRRTTMSAQALAQNKRAEALRQIVKISRDKNSTSDEELERLAQESEDVTVRAAALSTLSQRAAIGAVGYLSSRLMGDPNPQLRLAAATALVSVDPDKAMQLISEAANLEADPEVKEQLLALTLK